MGREGEGWREGMRSDSGCSACVWGVLVARVF